MQAERIYLDNAATSWPKPEAVYRAVDDYQRRLGAPAGRGAYGEAAEVERGIQRARDQLARLIGVADSRHIIFTCNGTDSLNLALYGLLQPGDHVVTSVVEHNSVLRPLRALEQTRDVSVTHVGCDGQGLVEPDEIRRAIRPETRLIALVHASNVTGALQPVEVVGRIAAEHEVWFLVDAAQTVGHIPIDVQRLGADLLAAPGHKGLLGPLGTGLLYIAPGLEQQLDSTRQGGTGTVSERDLQPDSLPDKYESGNHNVPGILGLAASLGYLRERGIDVVRQHEQRLLEQLCDGLQAINGVRVYGPARAAQRVAAVSVSVADYDPQEVAAMLDAACSIQVRAGIHCAPRMHKAQGTLALGGTVRFSPGAFSTSAQIEAALNAVAEIASAGAGL